MAELQIAHCPLCGTYSAPVNVPGCRHCGHPALEAAPLPAPPVLLNFVTLHNELAPGLPVPCVIGEVQLAPGLVEEALIGADESMLAIGQALRAEQDADGGPWRFVPHAAGSGA